MRKCGIVGQGVHDFLRAYFHYNEVTTPCRHEESKTARRRQWANRLFGPHGK
jgi:hypothetical protein